ncbi:MAG: alanine racemase [Flavobacteriales bacterium]|jgi:alanine racemase|nr:alanine racemase [Flavobacteriales bacterium]
MFAPCTITISRSALRNNLDLLRRRIGGARLCSVVKGNAYGHGLKPFIPLAMEMGVDYFAVYSADEAWYVVEHLRRRPDLFIMGMVEGDALAWAIDHGVEFAVYDMPRLDAALKLAAKLRKPARVHIEVETGMHRTGFDAQALGAVMDRLRAHPAQVELVGLFTHFAGAESRSNDHRVTAQMARFEHARARMEAAGLVARYAHQACSAAVMNYPGTVGPMARIGIMQYGFWPNQETWFRYSAVQGGDADPLRRIIGWHSRIMALTDVRAGAFIGYGAAYEAPHPMRIAVVPVGYAHGFTRGLSNFGKVLVRGQQAPVIGTVNMNAISVDVSGIEGVERGDDVVLIGEQGDQRITVASFSEMSEVLNYELLTRLPRHIPRTIVN